MFIYFFILGQIFTSLLKLRIGHHTTIEKEIKTWWTKYRNEKDKYGPVIRNALPTKLVLLVKK